MPIKTVSSPPISDVPIPAIPVPRLQNGERLSRDEFERRYVAMPEVKKAELIEGVVYMASPVSFARHANPENSLGGLFAMYSWHSPGVKSASNATVRLNSDNEPQPDLLLCVVPECNGSAQIVDGYIEGAPELVAEIASSSLSMDLNAKLKVYHRTVQEYVIWRVRDNSIEWFRLDGSEYQRLLPDDAGVIRSLVFPGLWIDTVALLKDDMLTAEKTLRAGLADASHQIFMQQLAERRKTST